MTNSAFRRGPKDEDGLSMACTVEAAKSSFERGVGTTSLSISLLKKIDGLNFVPDEECHGLIVGMPPHDSNYDLIMAVADKLLAIADYSPSRWNSKSE